MKKTILIILSLLITGLLTIGGCQTSTSTSTSFGLEAEQSTLAEYKQGQWESVEDNTFQKGDTVGLILLNVGEFKENEEGMNEMDIDVQVTNPNGEIVLDKKSLLGEKGVRDLENNIAKSPVGSFSSPEDIESGEYSVKVTVHDQVSEESVSASKTFTIE